MTTAVSGASAAATRPLFTIVKNRRAWWPVHFSIAAEDGGEVVKNAIEMRFRVVEVDEATELMLSARSIDEVARNADVGVAPAVTDPLSRRFAKFVMTIAEDWRGVGAENGQALPWSEDNLAALMNVPGVFSATMDAFRDCLAARSETRAKN